MKELIVFAGPNGSGKSTIANMFYSQENRQNIPFVNADLYAEQKFGHIKDLTARNFAAAKFAETKRYDYLNKRRSFAYETVLSTDRHIKFMQEAHYHGYFISTYYVITENADINVKRIKQRVQQGGHDVPEEKIMERFERCKLLLPQVIKNSDFFVLFDNSEKYRIVCLKHEDKYYLSANDCSFKIDELKKCFDFQLVSIDDIKLLAPSKLLGLEAMLNQNEY